MTIELMNQAIAEWRGYSFCRSEQSGGAEEWHDPDGEVVFNLLNYAGDLNAMHEAESQLVKDDDTCHLYVIHLESVVQSWMLANEKQCLFGDLWFWTNRATAAQRAEALLRTIGKWEDK